MARVLATCGRYARMIGTTARGEDEWRRWFAFDRYAPIGYPRNDVLYREPTEADLVNVDRKAFELAGQTLKAGKRVFLYAPTFRDADRGKWLLKVGLRRAVEALRTTGDQLLVNLHPTEQAFIELLAPALPGVQFVASGTDAYPLLGRTSALITDYSSVMFDYLHLQRPIIFFRPDHEAYTSRSRQLFDSKLRVMPGPVVEGAGSLAQLLHSRQLGQADKHHEARAALRAEWFDHHDGGASERLMALALEELVLASTEN
jgi:CDP-glycerol glycerophosphotransferase